MPGGLGHSPSRQARGLGGGSPPSPQLVLHSLSLTSPSELAGYERRADERRLDDTLQVSARMMSLLHVMLLVEVRVLVVMLTVVEAVLFFSLSLSSTTTTRTTPSTRPAGRCWGFWG